MEAAVDEIKWSDEILTLSQFIEKFSLPQIVKVEEGVYGMSHDDTFSSGQIIKLHSLTTERKVLCIDEDSQHVHIPYNTPERISFTPPENNSISFKLSELLMMKPRTNFVKTTCNLYIDAINDGDYDIHVEPDEKLQILYNEEMPMKDHVKFKTDSGETFSLPLTYPARFKAIDKVTDVLLSEILFNELGPASSVSFEFISHSGPYGGLSKLTCETIYDDDIVIASCRVNTELAAIFSVQKCINLSLKVALGTLIEDVDYVNLCQILHDFPRIEEELQMSRSSQIYRSYSDVGKVTYLNTKHNANDIYVKDDALYDISKEYQEKSKKPTVAIKPTIPLHSAAKKSASLPPIKPAVSRATKPKSPKNEIIWFNTKTSSENVDILSSDTQHADGNDLYASPSCEAMKSCEYLSHFPYKRTHSVPINAEYSTILDESLDEDRQTSGQFDQSQPALSHQGIQEVNKSVEDMSVEDISTALTNLHLGKHVQLFRDNQIDGFLLCELETLELRDLGLNSFEIKKLLTFKKGWRPKQK